MTMARIYLHAPNGVLDPKVMTTVVRGLLQYLPDVQLDSDEHGTFIQAPADVLEKFLADQDSKTEPVKRKPGRPKKTETRE